MVVTVFFLFTNLCGGQDPNKEEGWAVCLLCRLVEEKQEVWTSEAEGEGETDGAINVPEGILKVDAKWKVPVGKQKPEPAQSEQLEKMRALLCWCCKEMAENVEKVR